MIKKGRHCDGFKSTTEAPSRKLKCTLDCKGLHAFFLGGGEKKKPNATDERWFGNCNAKGFIHGIARRTKSAFFPRK